MHLKLAHPYYFNVFVCMYVAVSVCADANIPQYTYRGQRIFSGIGPHLPYCLRQDLLFCDAFTRIVGL